MQVKLSQLPSIDFKKRSRPPIEQLPFVLISKLESLPSDKRGIYFVLNSKAEILYIGMTAKSFHQRWTCHHRYEEIYKADSESKVHYWSLSLPREQLLNMESQLIFNENPTLNKTKIANLSLAKKQNTNARFSISLSDFYDERLAALAKLRGVNKATLAGHLLTEAIKQTYREDQPELEALANLLGVEINELPFKGTEDEGDD